jgi:hypothetical protein
MPYVILLLEHLSIDILAVFSTLSSTLSLIIHSSLFILCDLLWLQVNRLVEMGFTQERVVAMLAVNKDDEDAALNSLLSES